MWCSTCTYPIACGGAHRDCLSTALQGNRTMLQAESASGANSHDDDHYVRERVKLVSIVTRTRSTAQHSKLMSTRATQLRSFSVLYLFRIWRTTLFSPSSPQDWLEHHPPYTRTRHTAVHQVSIHWTTTLHRCAYRYQHFGHHPSNSLVRGVFSLKSRGTAAVFNLGNFPSSPSLSFASLPIDRESDESRA